MDVITLVLWSSDVDFEKKEHIVNIRKIGPSYVKSTTSKKKRIHIYFYNSNLIHRVGSRRVARGGSSNETLIISGVYDLMIRAWQLDILWSAPGKSKCSGSLDQETVTMVFYLCIYFYYCLSNSFSCKTILLKLIWYLHRPHESLKKTSY